MKAKLVLLAIITLLLFFAVSFYFYLDSVLRTQNSQQVSVDDAQEDGFVSGSDFTANISNELNQVPADASVEGEAKALDRDVEGF